MFMYLVALNDNHCRQGDTEAEHKKGRKRNQERGREGENNMHVVNERIVMRIYGHGRGHED